MLLTAIFRKTAVNQAFCECGMITPNLQVVGMNPIGLTKTPKRSCPFGVAAF